MRLARGGAVEGLSNDGEEIKLRVVAPGRALPREVYLWPDEGDHGCDCGLEPPCVHVCAALIAVHGGLKAGSPLPETRGRYRVKIRYDFTAKGPRVSLVRQIVFADGREEPLKGTLADASVMASRGDAQAESLLVTHPGGALAEEKLSKLLVFLEGKGEATLDGRPIVLSAEALPFRVRVTDEAGGFRVGLYRPPSLERLFFGAAVREGVLHPTTYGRLTVEQRRILDPRRADSIFATERIPWLVTEYLPRLEDLGVPVFVITDRLPKPGELLPRVIVDLDESVSGLKVRAELVYGDPAVARIRGHQLQILGGVVPVRDLAAERRERHAFEKRTGLVVGMTRTLPPVDAAAFLREIVPRLEVEVVGTVEVDRFRVLDFAVEPTVDVRQIMTKTGKMGGWALDVDFASGDGHADPLAVLRAWRTGRSLVPLMEGGYAPLPNDWLRTHGALLQELLEARDAQGVVHRNATAALVELCEDTKADVPPDLHRLREFLAAGEGLPEVELPDHFQAELRPYQAIGYRWLMFLAQTDLHGILADDMGLGKTVQALAALSAAGGRSLVVAPTSVLRNWKRESNRFAPNLRVCVYHGPGRTLDPHAHLTLTSYTLLRLDLVELKKVDWMYAVLDEAQFIKNADSQTARAACQIGARHRLCLTGTPVENRLEELWSLYRFLMPGLLGSQASFRDRYVRPIEAGDRKAGDSLRSRVKPYVLRRLKRQVAQDLPPLTEATVSCQMSVAQRKVYDTVRMAAQRQVQEALNQAGRGLPTMQVLEALLRMRQACCDPDLLPGDVGAHADSCKLDKLEEILVDLVVDGHRALVFSQWTSLLDRVEPRLRALDIPWVRLDGTTRDRQSLIDQFQEEDGPPVFLLSLKAGGTGLNLTAADYVIHLDPWWNPAVEQQATDRAHRIGQDKPVVSCRLIAAGTVEERILELQDAKRDLADAALGTEGGLLRALSAEELRSLFEAA